jgi:hypothetical protein
MEDNMGEWKLFCRELRSGAKTLAGIRELAGKNVGSFGVYPDSIYAKNGSYVFIARDNGRKALIVYGGGLQEEFQGELCEIDGEAAKICEMNNDNCRTIRRLFPFTNPVNHRGTDITIGLGDRLGLASPGHIRLVKDKPVFPVLAQQSIRELNLTERTYDDVLAAASWAVFQEGYEKGFGADGDHLKTPAEIKMALNAGYTMITLDCSEHIDNRAASLTDSEVDREYMSLPEEDRLALEVKYMGRNISLKDGTKLSFAPEAYKKIVLVYLKAVRYTISIYNDLIKGSGRAIDFEMSIDETLTSTSPESHYFVASELIAGGVEITSLAPRFCGEFQKGIDYRGDLKQFEREFREHVSIAEHFGYKLSIHSGSDKFSVFPVIGRETGGRYHLKTAGTNWLEAVRIITRENPGLYRRMHKFAVENLEKAKKYYHISADTSRVPDIDSLRDDELPGLMDMEDSRQVLHITYGLILTDRDAKGNSVFRDEIYQTLDSCEEAYYSSVEKHIGRHLEALGIK